LGIPSGPYSSVEINSEYKQKDKIIAKYLTNISGVVIDKKEGFVSYDFRDMYPNGLPEELKEVLNHNTLEIMKCEYEHQS
jgi:hypothetical protein